MWDRATEAGESQKQKRNEYFTDRASVTGSILPPRSGSHHAVVGEHLLTVCMACIAGLHIVCTRRALCTMQMSHAAHAQMLC